MELADRVLTKRVLEYLGNGVIPWDIAWNGPESHPRHLIGGKRIRGGSLFLMAAARYDSPYWLTREQAKELGGSVHAEARGHPNLAWVQASRGDPEARERHSYSVPTILEMFNMEHCDGINRPKIEVPYRDKGLSCEQILKNMSDPPRVKIDGEHARYDRRKDTIYLRPDQARMATEDFYSILFHELIHATSHEKRLYRGFIAECLVYGEPSFCQEELMAEMGATILCSAAGINKTPMEGRKQRIEGWTQRFRKNDTLFPRAAAQAHQAAGYILGDLRYESTSAGGRLRQTSGR